MDFLALMHGATPYGHLAVDNLAKLARQVGGTEDEVRRALAELIANGVCSVRPDGVIFSRRMVRDEERRLRNSTNGATGGNPALKRAAKPPDKPSDKGEDNPARAGFHSLNSRVQSFQTDLRQSDASPGKRERPDWVTPLRDAAKAIAEVRIRDLSLEQRLTLGRYFAWRFSNCTVSEARNKNAGAKATIAFAKMADSKLYADLTVRQYIDEAHVYHDRFMGGAPFYDPWAIRAVAEPVAS